MSRRSYLKRTCWFIVRLVVSAMLLWAATRARGLQWVEPSFAAGTLDQSQPTANPGFSLAATTTRFAAQTFTAGITGNLDQVDLVLDVFAPSGDVVVEIRTVSGGIPTSTVLGSGTLPAASIAAFPAPADWRSIVLTTTASVTASTQYAIVARATSPTVLVRLLAAPGDPYPLGAAFSSTDSGATWQPFPPPPLGSHDLAFRTFVTAAPTLTPTSTFTPTLTPITTPTVTPTPTLTPVVVTEHVDNQDRKAKQTDDERQHRQLTNRSGKDDVHTEGNVAAVDCSAGLPTVTIASRDGAVTVVLLHDAATVCSSIQVGDYLEADGTKQTEQRFEADDVTRGRRAP